jgi:hypothetical protein
MVNFLLVSRGSQGGVMKQQVFSSIEIFVNQLFKFEPIGRSTNFHKKFIVELIVGILGSRSTLISNISRFLNEPIPLKSTENRICKMLTSSHLPWEGLKLRAIDLGALAVGKDDIIAFDPGDVTKKYAKKMAYLYPVHDGSTGKLSLGWEDFGVEAIHWENKKKIHTPLHSKLTNASCPGYISQNHQIIEAIKVIHERLGDDFGIWTFDRGHDRNILFKFLLSLKIRWIVRLKLNRNLRFVDGEVTVKLEDFFDILQSSKPKTSWWLLFPKRSGELKVAWRKVKLPSDKTKRELNLVVIHDKRNEKPVVFLTNLPVHDDLSAMEAFGQYLERWGKEEGYRFCKSFLNLENIRPMNWPAIQNLALLVHLSYCFVSWFHRRDQEHIDSLCEENLKTFNSIDTIHYRYYRVGQLIQKLLCKEMNHEPGVLALMTEVG